MIELFITASPKHQPFTRLVFLDEPAPSKINEDAAKFYAGILLCDERNQIRIPTYEEWIGVNLLERDDELRRMY